MERALGGGQTGYSSDMKMQVYLDDKVRHILVHCQQHIFHGRDPVGAVNKVTCIRLAVCALAPVGVACTHTQVVERWVGYLWQYAAVRRRDEIVARGARHFC